MNQIYGLVCPVANAIRYVGKTKNTLHSRLLGHLADAKARKYEHHASRWIRALLSDGKTPSIVLLEVVGDNWEEAESRWIAKGKAEGWPLTNSTTGGDGCHNPAPETSERRRVSMRKVWQSQDFADRIKSARNDPAFVEKQSGRLKRRWEEDRDGLVGCRWDSEARQKQAAEILDRKDKIDKAMTPEVRAKQAATLKATWAKRKAEGGWRTAKAASADK